MNCPYCQSDSDCDHLALATDTYWREFEAGEFMSAIEEIREYLDQLVPEASENGFSEASEKVIYDTILKAAEAVVDSTKTEEIHDRPGLPQSYRFLYCASTDRVSQAWQIFLDTAKAALKDKRLIMSI